MTEQELINILGKINIPFSVAGAKNVSDGHLGIKCPYCDDKSNHLGISTSNGGFSCWRCRASGSLVKLVQKLTGWSSERSTEIIEECSNRFNEDSSDIIQKLIDNRVGDQRKVKARFEGLPRQFRSVTTITDFPPLKSYMKRREISITTLIKNQCGICRSGKYMNRLIIPIIFKGKIVSFQAADLTGRANLKYDTAPGDINQHLYNYDSIKVGGRIIVTEGILDCWRIGDDSVATFGTHTTDAQFKLILNKKPSELIFAWDGDYYLKAIPYNSAVGQFLPFINKIKIVKFPEGEDPDSYGVKYRREGLLKLINDTDYWDG